MNNLNKDIVLWLGNGTDKKLQFYALKSHKDNEEKQIQGLLRRMMWPNRFSYPIAKLYIRGKLVKTWVQGIETTGLKETERFYGQDISAFKLKIIKTDGTFEGPFYSNALLNIENQFKTLIEQLKYQFERKFLSAIIMDINNDKDEIYATIKPTKTGFLNIKYHTVGQI